METNDYYTSLVLCERPFTEEHNEAFRIAADRLIEEMFTYSDDDVDNA